MIKSLNARHLFWLFLFAMTALRLRVASQFGLGVDEAHYVLYAKHLDWSYFDHPPLVGWTQALFQLLPVTDLIKARLAPIIISVFTSILAFNFLCKKNLSEHDSILAVIVLNLTPMFNAMSLAFLPDTLLMPLCFLILTQTEKILAESNFKNWALLGLCLGLAGLSKYTAILFVFALVLIFISERKFNELLKPQLWLGVLLAFILVSPVLYWNIKNHFSSFQYQADHVLSLDSGILKNMGASFAIQFVSWGLGPFWVSLVGFFLLLKNFKVAREYRVSLIFLSVFLLFFIYVSVAEVMLPHWMLMYFVVMIPIAYALFLKRQNLKLVYSSFAISALLSLVLLFEMGFKIFPTRWTAGLYEGVAGWDELLEVANQKLDSIDSDKKALAVMNWTLGSRAMYYNKKNSQVFVIDQRHDQFDIWAPQSALGYDLLVMVEATKKEEHLKHLNCAQLTSVGEKIFSLENVTINHFLYYHCAHFIGYKD